LIEDAAGRGIAPEEHPDPASEGWVFAIEVRESGLALGHVEVQQRLEAGQGARGFAALGVLWSGWRLGHGAVGPRMGAIGLYGSTGQERL
jgi:hypothetical protein